MAATDRDPIEQLAEEWRERWRRGEKFNEDEYVARYPELAGDIRDLFPAIAMMEELKPAANDVTGVMTVASGIRGAEAVAGVPLERLGDFRILREIGRGGMGIVYEAEQESLGRHVALKVLPAEAAQRPIFLERFRREARTAARLHHTNIVPVYGVGEENGSCYYAMQFIQGQPLDVVIEEIKRLRGLDTGAEQANQQGRAAAVSVAQSLITGRFAEAEPAVAPGPTVATPPASNRSDLGDQPEARYYRRVALLGVQAAQALAYAHSQGVLHRDIKPANLLLDDQGTLWITDFGLAKAKDADNLTQVGDIVGTIRYMAPERFEGKSDARSDIHALGVTLYELLALRPAFGGEDRAKLIGEINSDALPPLRPFAPHVPRDLETIVLKAMARDPAARYAGAADMAEDLQRFLDNRPIKARRVAVVERFRRWCRRNPVVAGLTLALFVLLAGFAAASTVAAFWLHQERDIARTAEERARKEEEAKTEKLFDSYVAQARASRFSRQVGQRFATLDAVREAVRIARERKMPPKQFDELRTLAIACLALPDWRTLHEWNAFPEGATSWDWDDRHDRYARANLLAGQVSVRRIADDGEIVRLPFVPGEFWLRFSPDGRFLLAHGAGRLRVWDLGVADSPVVLDQVIQGNETFHPDSRRLIVSRSPDSIVEYDLLAPREAPRLLAKLPSGPIRAMSFDPEGERLAVAVRSTVQVLDAKTGKLIRVLVETGRYGKPTTVEYLAWHPQGDFLATVCQPNHIHVWDVNRMQRVSVLEGCRSAGVSTAFTPDGQLLLSQGFEGKLRFWNWRTGQQLLHHPGGSTFRFSPEGRLMITESNNARLIEVVPGREYRTLVRQSNASADLSYWIGDVHPDGRLFALTMTDGIRLWDLETGNEVGLIRLPYFMHLKFATAESLLTNGSGGLLHWPVRHMGADFQFGPPEYLTGGAWVAVSTSKDGQVIAQARQAGSLVLHRDRLERPIMLQPQSDVRTVSISPDGRFVATSTFGSLGVVKLWQADNGRWIKDEKVGPFALARFSPDGNWLAVRGDLGGKILRVGTWKEEVTFEFPDSGNAFTPDSRFFAVESGQGAIRLVDPTTGSEKVRLEDPNQEPAYALVFTPDGTRLLAISDDAKATHVWDLRLIRRQLAELDLDWDAPPYPPAPAPQKLEPLHVTVIGAELAGSVDAMIQSELQSYALRLLVNPFDAEAYFQRGRLHLQNKSLAQGRADLNAALAFLPNHAGALYLRGRLHQQQRRPKEACDDFTRLLEMQPNDLLVRRLRGECSAALGDDVGAVDDYSAWVQDGRELSPVILNNLAWRLVARSKERRNAELALPLIEKAEKQTPGQYHYVHTLGVTYYRLGRYQEAESTLERAVKLLGNKPTAAELYFLAMCRHRLGNVAKAKQDFDEAVGWHDMANLRPEQVDEFRSFRPEAEAVLQEKPR